jgi:hypothetical protein
VRMLCDGAASARVVRGSPKSQAQPAPTACSGWWPGLVAGALPAVTLLNINSMHVGDAGASALAAALDRGALPRLKALASRFS